MKLLQWLGLGTGQAEEAKPITDNANDPVVNSQEVDNEINVVAHIRSLIAQLRALGIQHRRNYLLQWQEYIQDIDAPAKPSRFTDLEEANRQLNDHYESITTEIRQHIKIYDHYCEQNRLEYSAPWNQLLTDLRGYLGGISSASFRHSAEAAMLSEEDSRKT